MSQIVQKFGIFILGIVATILLSVGSNDFDISTMVKRALAPEKAIADAVEYLQDTPKPEIVDAVKEQTKDPQAVAEVITDIKPTEPATPTPEQ